MVEHFGQFYVACGLAIQGLDRSAVTANLAPPEADLRRRLGQWVHSRKAKAAWGLDLGRTGLKAVKLVLDGEKQAVLKSCAFIEHRKPFSQALSEEEEGSLVAETLSTFLSHHDPRADRICLGVPGGMFLLRNFNVPKMDPKKLAGAVVLEARNHFPIPLEQLTWTYWVLKEEKPAWSDYYGANSKGSGKEGMQCEIALVGVRRPPFMAHLRKFEASGLRADVVQCDCLALHNYLVFDRLRSGDGGEGGGRHCIAALDVGGDTTHFVVSAANFVWFRSASLGSERINQALVRRLQATFANAEQWKRRPPTAPNVVELYEAMIPVFGEFAQELRASLTALRSAKSVIEPERILVVGGGIRAHGLLGSLQRELPKEAD